MRYCKYNYESEVNILKEQVEVLQKELKEVKEEKDDAKKKN